MAWKTGSRRPKSPLEVVIDGVGYKGWVSDIFRFYIRRAGHENRQLPIGWEDRVWRALKEKYPVYIIEEKEKEAPVTVSVSTILSFLQFVKSKGWDRTVVSTQVAESRARICAGCPLSTIMVGCTKCKAAVRAVAGSPKIEFDYGEKHGKKVQACGACGCFLDVKVWMPLEFIEVSEAGYWENCWVRRDDYY